MTSNGKVGAVPRGSHDAPPNNASTVRDTSVLTLEPPNRAGGGLAGVGGSVGELLAQVPRQGAAVVMNTMPTSHEGVAQAASHQSASASQPEPSSAQTGK